MADTSPYGLGCLRGRRRLSKSFCRGQGWSTEDDSVIISAFKSSLSVLQSYYCLFFACHDQILDNSRVEASDIG